MEDRKIFFIVGPTASGKTSLSIELAKKIKDVEIVSADSRQIYRDFDLSSGKVTKREMEGISHHMLDIVDPGEYFSVVDYTDMALKVIRDIFSRKKTPIVVGGTGFYIDSLLYDYNLPDVKADEGLRKDLEKKDKEELFTILKSFDFNFAHKHDTDEFKNNKHRLVRAIEIATALGRVPELKKTLRFKNFEIIQTNLSRLELKEKINSRLKERLEQGMIEEIKNVKEKYNLDHKYLEGLGLEFKWVSKFLQGEISQEEMVLNLQKQIYQYARRQEAWFKRYK